MFFIISFKSYTQFSVECVVELEEKNDLKAVIKIYNKDEGFIDEALEGEVFLIESEKSTATFIFIANDYSLIEKEIDFNDVNNLKIVIPRRLEKLNEIVLNAKKKDVFALKRMKDFEKTAIYAGKKTEVILVGQSMANLASNNARQIFNQIPGLNIYQNDDAGLQLHIGGRGLDPNRTSNFNTRQNNYDISADVLGYPESYYSPPSESLSEIQIVRGAASLQYGTQFGGLVNFITKSPNTEKPLELVLRNTVGSNNLYTNFTSFSGTSKKLSYYSYINYKIGDGFRPNSEFESKNFFSYINYDFSPKTNLEFELTYLEYLAQQAGGLNDSMFDINPYQSVRSRNWFKVNLKKIFIWFK
jgi:Fe(3+) dicitrate transport protein